MTIQELIVYAKKGYDFIDIRFGNIYKVYDVGDKSIVLISSNFKSIRKENAGQYLPKRDWKDDVLANSHP